MAGKHEIGRRGQDLETKRKDIERTLKDLKDIRSQCVEHLNASRLKAQPPPN